jgi:hypothetical protein
VRREGHLSAMWDDLAWFQLVIVAAIVGWVLMNLITRAVL